jgi:undecaprenyl-diphosphatase
LLALGLGRSLFGYARQAARRRRERCHFDAHAVALLLIGLLAGSLASFAAVWGLMRFLERMSSWPFVLYRGCMGILLLAGVAAGWLH